MPEVLTPAAASSYRRRPRPVEWLLLVVLVGDIVLSTTMSALTPTLLRHHSVVLEVLQGSSVGIATTAALARTGHAVLLVGLLAPLCAIVIYDLASYAAGRVWGNRALHLYTRGSPRRQRWLARAEALVRRRGVVAVVLAYFLPVPNYIVYTLCGLSDMRLLVFVLGDVAGTLLWSGLLTALGWSLGHRAVTVVDAVQHDAVTVTVALAVAVLLVLLVRRRRQRAAGAGRDAG